MKEIPKSKFVLSRFIFPIKLVDDFKNKYIEHLILNDDFEAGYSEEEKKRVLDFLDDLTSRDYVNFWEYPHDGIPESERLYFEEDYNIYPIPRNLFELV